MAENTQRRLELMSLLKGILKHKASDLHLKVDRPPMYRINGSLVPTKLPTLTSSELKELAYSMMNTKLTQEFEENQQIDFGYMMPGLARFRANVFMQRGSVSIVIRAVPFGVPSLDQLGMPPIVKELALKRRGLILVTGATGSGKSTTLAAMVDHINENTRGHILTIEDPIEFIHSDKTCSVSQREIGTDAPTSEDALRSALRQDPDVIILGEMRDYNAIQTAITASETGHLVISTLHTKTASQSLDRVIDSFPAEAKNQVRMQLANSIQGVICQRLVKRADGNGQVCACEILVKSPTVERIILENKLEELEGTIEQSSLYYKMQTMNQALAELVNSGVVTEEDARRASDKEEDLGLKLSGMLGGGQRDLNAETMVEQTKIGKMEETALTSRLDSTGIKLEEIELDKASGE